MKREYPVPDLRCHINADARVSLLFALDLCLATDNGLLLLPLLVLLLIYIEIGIGNR